MSTTKIGVVGYSRTGFDIALAEDMLLSAIKTIVLANPEAGEFEIVSGLTNIGIPKLAYEIADSLGYRTIGISAARALRVGCGIYDVDKTIIEGEEFGDESGVFVEYIDYLIRVGGGKQSQAEVGLFSSKCRVRGFDIRERLIEHELSSGA